MKNRIKSLPNKWYDVLYSVLFLGLLIYWVVRSIMSPTNEYMDLFYNYAGGFIRRGLGGEIMFWANDYLGIPTRIFFLIISWASYVTLGYITIRLMRRRGYRLNVLIMPFILGGVLTFGIDMFRRDYIELLLFAITVLLFHKMEWKKWCLVSNLMIIFGILLHEATFFFTVPILILITNLYSKNIIIAISCWLPSILTFFVCCYFKGTPDMIQPIVERAAQYYPQGFETGTTPYILSFIGKDTLDVFAFHFGMNYTNLSHNILPVFFITLFFHIYIIYMTVAMLCSFSPKVFSENAASSLIKIMCIQFICLLPMSTVLSCDLLRVCTYWIVTSILVWLILSEEEVSNLFKHRYNILVEKSTTKLLPFTKMNRLSLTLLTLFVGITVFYRSIRLIFTSSLIWTILEISKKGISFILSAP